MMNPWDRERTYEEPQGERTGMPDTGGNGLLWRVAIVIAVIGLALMARHGANNLVMVPIGISVFFMVMFLFSHRREARRIAWKREVARMQEVERARQQQVVAADVPRANDVAMRKIFDRYDLKVINHGRMYGWGAKDIASFLDYARDFVDTRHAGRLLEGNERGELDRHLDAALERAVLQHDIERPGKLASEEPPF
jgi:hypothetical protein